MKFTYDKRGDAICILFREGARISRDSKLSENVFAGFDRDGNLIEIQILEASAQVEKPWITLEAAAQMLGKSTRTLMRWIDQGKIRPKKVGREYRITPEMLKKLAS